MDKPIKSFKFSYINIKSIEIKIWVVSDSEAQISRINFPKYVGL
jgi:hypothetical protein